MKTKEVRHGQAFSTHTTVPDSNRAVYIPKALALKLVVVPPKTERSEGHRTAPSKGEGPSVPGEPTLEVFGVQTGGIWEPQYN